MKRFLAACIASLLLTPSAQAQNKTFQIMDNQGFEAPMVAFTITVPQNWQVSGEVVWRKPCSANDLYELILTARGPDGRTGVRIMPGHKIVWNDVVMGGMDPQLEHMMLAQQEAERNRMRTQFQGSNCHVTQISSAEQIFNALVLSKRPQDTKVIKRTKNEAQRQNFAQMFGPSQPGMQVFFDAEQIEMTYALGGRPIVERLAFSWYMFQSEFRDPGMHSLNQYTTVESFQFDWIAPERRAADEAVIKQISASFKSDPAWEQRILEVQRKMAEQRRQQNADNAQQRERNRLERDALNDKNHRRFLQYIQQ
ncbi:MAG: hypothetical protein AB8B51_16305 [Sedimentitalea sp.]